MKRRVGVRGAISTNSENRGARESHDRILERVAPHMLSFRSDL